METLKTEKNMGKQHDAAVEDVLHGLRVFDAEMEDGNWSGVLYQLRTRPSSKHKVCKWQKVETNTAENIHTYSQLERKKWRL